MLAFADYTRQLHARLTAIARSLLGLWRDALDSRNAGLGKPGTDDSARNFFRWLGPELLSSLAALFALGLIATAWYEGSLTTGYQIQTFHFWIVRVGFSFLAGVLLVLPVPEAVRWGYDAVCVLVLFPMLILAGAASQPRGGKLVAVFGRMGGASYALYAIHVPNWIGYFKLARAGRAPFGALGLACTCKQLSPTWESRAFTRNREMFFLTLRCQASGVS